MQITELLKLTDWMNNKIKPLGLLQSFDELISILEQNSQTRNQQAQSFENERINLLAKQREINTSVLSDQQVEVLDQLNILWTIGDQGAENVEFVLSNTLDIAHVTEQVRLLRQALDEGISKLDAMNASLQTLELVYEDGLQPDEILTRVTFQHDASIKDIEQFKKWATKWHDIGRGFAVASGQRAQDIRVIGASRGSIIIELAVLAATALPIAKALDLILGSMVKVQELRLFELQIREMKANTPIISDDLEQEANRWGAMIEVVKQSVVDDVTTQVKESIFEFEAENFAALQKSVKSLVEFIDLGGDVDCVPQEEIIEDEHGEAEEHPAAVRLNQDFARIREMKQKLLFIEHKKPDDPGVGVE